MAEAKKTIVVVPVILEVPEVELEIVIGVPVRIRNPAVAIEKKLSFVHHIVHFHRKQHLSPSVFYAEPLLHIFRSLI